MDVVGRVLLQSAHSCQAVSIEFARPARQCPVLSEACSICPQVGVFVDEDAETIARVCAECDVRIAQLHGDGARGALGALPVRGVASL